MFPFSPPTRWRAAGTPSKGLDIAAEYILAAEFRPRAWNRPCDGYFQTADFNSVGRNMTEWS